jgi:hypothetical protein
MNGLYQQQSLLEVEEVIHEKFIDMSIDATFYAQHVCSEVMICHENIYL